MIKIYTDGACSGNPGKGAAAFAVIKDEELVHKETFPFRKTTNNIAELTAVMMAIDYALANNIQECRIHSDSQYVVNGINTWMHKWVKNGWGSSTNTVIKNVKLWQHVYELWCKVSALSNCSIHHVKGHSTDKWNLFVDKLAQAAVKELKKK